MATVEIDSENATLKGTGLPEVAVVTGTSSPSVRERLVSYALLISCVGNSFSNIMSANVVVFILTSFSNIFLMSTFGYFLSSCISLRRICSLWGLRLGLLVNLSKLGVVVYLSYTSFQYGSVTESGRVWLPMAMSAQP